MDWKSRKTLFIKKLQRKDYADLKRLVSRRFFINFVMRPIGIIPALILIPLLYLIEPFLKFRFAIIPSDRIGHLALNTEIFLRRKQLNPEDHSKVKRIFILNQGKAANQQLLKMFKRKLFILENQWAYWTYAVMAWVFNKTKFIFELPLTDTEYYEFINAKTTLVLTEEEVKKGDTVLKKMGIDPQKDWFVCIHSRDGDYLKNHFPNVNWSYHDYRDSDINDFQKALQFIVDQGGYVIRMGSDVEKPLEIQHEKVIDYAVTDRSDFMDIYLIAKCKFFLGTTSGICDVAIAMDKPRLAVNYCPFGVALIGKDCIYLPKKVKNQKTGQYIPLSEWLHHGWDRKWDGLDMMERGQEYENNTPQEILEATKEMMARVDGTFQMSAEEHELMQKYFDLFQPENLSYNIKTPVGLDFLKKNPEVFWQ